MARRDDAIRTVLVAVVAALLGFGAIMIYSTTARGDGALVHRTFIRQMVYMIVGLAAAFVMGRVDYHILLRHNRLILGMSMLLLALVLVPGIGSRVNGASRWLRFGGIGLGFQPSEMAKLAVIIFLAAFLSQNAGRLKELKAAFLPAIAVVGAVCMLVLPEPDIGTTVLIASVAWIMLFIAGARLAYLFAPTLLAAPALFLIVNRGYARARIDAWLDPWQDPAQTGYHIIQSLIAVGSGGVWGVGLGASRQKLFFLPEAPTDFIFAILAEETGLIGCTVVLLLYAAFIACGFAVARRAADAGGALLALGLTAIVSLQALINIGVVTQVLPTKGIPLPFISSGGSSIVFMLMGVGILYNIGRYSAGPAALGAPVETQVV